MLKSKLKSFLFSSEFNFWTISILSLLFYLHPLLSNEHPAGWDTPGHYFLFEKMISLVSSGNLTGYDTSWLGGYSLFTLYPPFTYLFLTIVYFLFFTLIPKIFLFNLFLFILPVFFLFSLRFAISNCFSKKYVVLGLYVGLLYLFVPINQAHMGIGLGGMFFVGLPSNNFALCFLLLQIGYLKKLQKLPSFKYVIISSLISAIIICTHLLTGLFLIFIWGLFLLFNWNLKKHLSLLAIITLILTLPWLWTFFSYLPYSSGTPIGLRHDIEGFSDPFFTLFPNLNFNFLKGLFNSSWNHIKYPFSLFKNFSFTIEAHPMLVYFPFSSFVFLLGSIFGLSFLIKKQKYFLPCLFITSLLLLPRDLLTHLIPLDIHYYRFSQFIFVINIFIITYGLYSINNHLKQNKPYYKVIRCLSLTYFTLAIFFSLLFGIKWNIQNEHGHYSGINPNFQVTQKNYRKHSDINYLVNFLSNYKITGRIAIESPGFAMYFYGSPHILSSLLPLKQNYETLPGLLAESSLSTGFINPTIRKHSNHLIWGRDNLSKDPTFQEQSFKSMLTRLSYLGTEYIISFSLNYYNALKTNSKTTLIKKFGEIALFRLDRFRPKFVTSDYNPFLFIDLGGTDFRNFSEHWYKYTSLLNHPIIFSKKPFSELPQNETQKIKGLILSFPGNSKLPIEEYRHWKKQKKDILFLNIKPPDELPASEKKYFIKDFHLNHKKWRNLFIKDNKISVKWSPITANEIREKNFLKEILTYSKNPVLINYNYDICWKSKISNQTVYWTTPSQIFVFGNGPIVLECKH